MEITIYPFILLCLFVALLSNKNFVSYSVRMLTMTKYESDKEKNKN